METWIYANKEIFVDLKKKRKYLFTGEFLLSPEIFSPLSSNNKHTSCTSQSCIEELEEISPLSFSVERLSFSSVIRIFHDTFEPIDRFDTVVRL